MSFLLNSIYYYLGYDDEEIICDPKTLRIRNEMLKQIKHIDKLKLNKIITNADKLYRPIQKKPTVYNPKPKKIFSYADAVKKL